MNEIRDVLRLTIGPLHYEFLAHDAWGMDALGRLRTNVTCMEFEGTADRVLHLAELKMSTDENAQINRDWLPDRFARLLPENSERQGWHLTGDETGHLTCHNNKNRHVLFIFGAIPFECVAPFQLPWPVLLEDIIPLGGGIVHGGLISHHGRGYIVTAPPGGGKTTAIRQVPAEWGVLADDACLVWPVADKQFLASPLPTWSVLLGRGTALPAIGRWKTATIVQIRGIILLSKGDHAYVTAVRSRRAIPAIYQGLCEHPRVITNRNLHRSTLFDVARNLSDAIPTWRLCTGIDGNPWKDLR